MSNRNAFYRRLANLWEEMNALLEGGAGQRNLENVRANIAEEAAKRNVRNVHANIQAMKAALNAQPVKNARHRAALRVINGAERLALAYNNPYPGQYGLAAARGRVGRAARRAKKTKPPTPQSHKKYGGRIVQANAGDPNQGSNNAQNSGRPRVERRERQAKASRLIQPGAKDPAGPHPTLSRSENSVRRELEKNIKKLAKATNSFNKAMIGYNIKTRMSQLRRNKKPMGTPVIHKPLAPGNTPRTFRQTPQSGRLSGVRRANPPPAPHAGRSKRLFSQTASPPPAGEQLPPGRNSNSNVSNFSVGSQGSNKK